MFARLHICAHTHKHILTRTHNIIYSTLNTHTHTERERERERETERERERERERKRERTHE